MISDAYLKKRSKVRYLTLDLGLAQLEDSQMARPLNYAGTPGARRPHRIGKSAGIES
jgi:hypothetical protein